MIVGGIHARIAGKRFEVAITVLDGTNVIDHTVLPAPAGEAQSGQLCELQIRAHEVLRASGAEAVVLWQLDPPPGGRVRLIPVLDVGRAEGAVLAAAGDLGIEVAATVAGATVRSAAARPRTEDAVDELCGDLTNLPPAESARRAAAAARAWIIKSA